MSLTIPRRFVRMFKPEFRDRVACGLKKQTVRPWPRRVPVPGDIFDGRVWTGRPYASPQERIIEAPIVQVARCRIDRRGIVVDKTRLSAEVAEEFARADGFPSLEALLAWFEREHGLPFKEGIFIQWQP